MNELAPLLIAVFLGTFVFGARKLFGISHERGNAGHELRRFFQFGLLFSLCIISTTGFVGLFGKVFSRQYSLLFDQVALARDTSFSVVGVGLIILLAFWTRRTFRADVEESNSFGWIFYLSATSLFALIQMIANETGLLKWAIAGGEFSGKNLAGFLGWGGLWLAHFLILRKKEKTSTNLHESLAGSLIGLIVSTVGLIQLLSSTIHVLLGFDRQDILIWGKSPISQGLVLLLVAAPIWYLYWIRTSAKVDHDRLWKAYILLAGIASGLILAISGASFMLYKILIWFFGDSGLATARDFFSGTPLSVSTSVSGFLIWWYHRDTLLAEQEIARSEIRRLYEYLMSSIGLVASSIGISMVFVSFLEAISRSALLAKSGSTNSMLLAATFILVGGPIWWFFWSRIQRLAKPELSSEIYSPTRRIYLFLLFGVGGIISSATLIIVVFNLFEDLFQRGVGLHTLWRARLALAILISTAAVAWYHWIVFSQEKSDPILSKRTDRSIYLVGPEDPLIQGQVAAIYGGKVILWTRADGSGGQWSMTELLDKKEEYEGQDLIILCDPTGNRVIPINRSIKKIRKEP